MRSLTLLLSVPSLSYLQIWDFRAFARRRPSYWEQTRVSGSSLNRISSLCHIRLSFHETPQGADKAPNTFDFEDEKGYITQARRKTETNLQLIHHMNPRVPKILSHFGQKHLHFLGLPTQKLRVYSEGEPFETVFNLHKIPAAEHFLRGCVLVALLICETKISFLVWKRSRVG